MSLIKYIVKRVLALIPILFGSLFLSFWLTSIMPGNPFLANMGERWTATQLAIMERNMAELGFDGNTPVIVGYFKYIWNIFNGRWGESISFQSGAPVWVLIADYLPVTVELTIMSVTIAASIGIWAGKVSATNRNRPKDTLLRVFALVGVAVPIFWLGLLMQYLFAYKLNWLDGSLYKNPTVPDPPLVTSLMLLDSFIYGVKTLVGNWYIFFDIIRHMIMPVTCLAFVSIANITRQTRSSMLEVLQLDYIRTARAKGASERVVINKHAFSNARIPVITVVGLNFAGLLGGAVLTETTFNLRGMGTLLISAIQGVDYFVINACVFYITIIFVLANLAIDVLYGVMDPRIRY